MDTVSPQVRSRMMAAVKSKNTSLERIIFAEMKKWGVPFRRHYKALPGTPDIALPHLKRAVFIDGDFWHGYRYPAWKAKITSKFWREKIETNRLRDRNNFRKIRRLGWKVLRIWEHELKSRREKTLQGLHKFVLH